MTVLPCPLKKKQVRLKRVPLQSATIHFDGRQSRMSGRFTRGSIFLRHVNNKLTFVIVIVSFAFSLGFCCCNCTAGICYVCSRACKIVNHMYIQNIWVRSDNLWTDLPFSSRFSFIWRWPICKEECNNVCLTKLRLSVYTSGLLCFSLWLVLLHKKHNYHGYLFIGIAIRAACVFTC